ncbi:hypothetical protein [Streptosporangium saharense]|uniref:Uncharacterized protein n=1 Tax=Streptosporangium saharense TaxID=1706840 RepID=A0A7W7QK82_9ACTN|nr:hypothetical protein [Streptosporangium saharense]MBB4915084.1 hypothetical protein [Streptosporangium saharense]
MSQTPAVGEVVHYVSHGAPEDADALPCRAAIVTEVAPDGNTVGLAVLDPFGMSFRDLAEGGCEHHETYGVNPPPRRGGTWHRPEQA